MGVLFPCSVRFSLGVGLGGLSRVAFVGLFPTLYLIIHDLSLLVLRDPSL